MPPPQFFPPFDLGQGFDRWVRDAHHARLDDSDDDIVFLSHPPSPVAPPPPLARRTVIVKRLEVCIPDCPQDLRMAYAKAKQLEPKLRLDRLCEFLEQVLRHTGNVDSLIDRIVIIGTDGHARPCSTFARESALVLRTLFPRYKAGEVTRALNEHHFLSAAYSALLRNPNPQTLKNVKPAPMRIQVELVPLALEVLEIVDAEAAERSDGVRDRAAKFEYARAVRAIVECQCCFTECLPEDIVRCSAGHAFCKGCLIRAVDALIGEGRSDLRCLQFGGCDAPIEMAELERSVPEKRLRLLFATETQAAVAGMPGLVRCHHCSNCVVLGCKRDWECPECKAETCGHCGARAHPSITCEQSAGMDANRFVEEQINEAIVRVCPKCKAQFIKEEGCNKMECPRCHTWICYWCRKEIPREIGYGHFWRAQGACPPDKCPLWVSDSTLHRLEEMHAKERAAEEIGKNV
jgi:TRIAD3 protein (E3 ubiquitin-protein ligase RNF216)